MAAAAAGATATSQLKPFATALAPPALSGPMTSRVNGTMISSEKNGVNSGRSTAGRTLLRNFSRYDSSHTRNSGGSTDEV